MNQHSPSGRCSTSRHAARRTRVLLSLVVAFGLAAACSGDYDRLTTATTTTRATTTTAPGATTSTTARPAPTTTTPPGVTAAPGVPTTTVPGSLAGLPGRLAVIALDGSLLTIKPDGTDPKVLAIGSPGASVATPTWSSDATRLIWTAFAINSVRVRTATVDGSNQLDAALSPQPTVYLWNQSSTAVAALRTLSTTAVELDLLALTTLVATPLRTGGPLYAAWSPDGTQLLVHAAADELSVVRAASGAVTRLPVRAGSFGTPQWLDDKTVLVGVRDGSSQFLSLVDITTGARRDLVGYTGSIRFQMNAAGTQVAYQVLPESGGGTSSNVAFPQTTTPAPVPQATQNQLVVFDIATRKVTTVSSTLAAAFVWSPDGLRLAYLTTEADGTYRWRFFTKERTVDGAAFVPTREFLRLSVGQFDQFTQSVRWWSPDSAAFVYAGRAGSRIGIWVQQPLPGAAPVFVAEGDSAVWSPVP